MLVPAGLEVDEINEEVSEVTRGKERAATADRRPLLLLDIDGVLNPTGRGEDCGFLPSNLHGFRVSLCLDHGVLLNDLDREGEVELCWATTWNENANHDVGPALGLSRPLPVLPIDRALAGPVPAGTNWKTPSVVAGVGDRPCAWIDDWIGPPEQQWAEDRILAGIPTLLIRTDPGVGLLPEHVDRVRSWARRTAAPATLTARDLLTVTPGLGDAVGMPHAQTFARVVRGLPETVPCEGGVLTREALLTGMWSRCAPAIGTDQGGPVLALAQQAIRRFLRGDGDAATIWADIAAVRAAQLRDDVDAKPATGHRLDLAETPGRSAAAASYEAARGIQQLIDTAVAEIGVRPQVRRSHRSVYFHESLSFVQINVRESRGGAVTVAFGHDGRADRIPYTDVLRMAPEDVLSRVLDVHSAQLGTTDTRGGYVSGGMVLNPSSRRGPSPRPTR